MRHPKVIPSEVEGSRRENLKVTSSDPSTSLRMTGTCNHRILTSSLDGGS
jgi:hypothetical protein